MAQSRSEDVLADFAHQLRQPLSTLEALTSFLDLITPEDTRIREQLRRLHVEIASADQILCEGMRMLRAYLEPQAGPRFAPNPLVAPSEGVAEELSRPLTSAAMASVTY